MAGITALTIAIVRLQYTCIRDIVFTAITRERSLALQPSVPYSGYRRLIAPRARHRKWS
jgi:hypothetical protein